MVGFLISVLLLAVLILIHELGHFFAARLFKVEVPTFSIGFGPKVFKFNFKGTEFSISAFPLGGYIKMKGGMEQNEENIKSDKNDLRNKALWQKATIVIAGPLANIIFAWVFIFIADLSMSQYYIPTTSVGRIVINSSADLAGLEPLDEIENINNIKTNDWAEVENSLFLNSGETLKVNIKRIEGISTVEKNIFIPPDSIDSFFRGISPYIPPVIGRVIGFPAEEAGLLKGDKIICFVFFEDEYTVDTSFIPMKLQGTGIGIEYFDTLSLSFVDKGLTENSLKSIRIEYWMDIGTIINSIESDSFLIGIIRENEKHLLLVKSQFVEDGRKVIGITYDLPSRRIGIKGAFLASFQQIKATMYLMVKLPEMIRKKQISIKETVGGPVRIFQETSKAAKMGFDTLLFIAGFISLNLGIFNLFPLLPLDGGHLLIYIIESLIRRPLNFKFVKGFQIIGLTILLSAVVLVTANDIVRLFQ